MRPDIRWLAGVVLAWLCLAGAALAARPLLRVLLDSAAVQQADATVAAALQAHLGAPAMAVMRGTSLLFDNVPMVTLVLLVVAGLAWRRQPDRAAHLLACVPLGMLLNATVKLAVQRPRPDLPYTQDTLASFSFPSGHTTQAALLSGWVLLQAWPLLHGQAARGVAALAAVAVVVLVGTSRVALGVHHPSDCVASVATAALWLAWCTATAPAGFVPGRRAAARFSAPRRARRPSRAARWCRRSACSGRSPGR